MSQCWFKANFYVKDRSTGEEFISDLYNTFRDSDIETQGGTRIIVEADWVKLQTLQEKMAEWGPKYFTYACIDARDLDSFGDVRFEYENGNWTYRPGLTVYGKKVDLDLSTASIDSDKFDCDVYNECRKQLDDLTEIIQDDIGGAVPEL